MNIKCSEMAEAQHDIANTARRAVWLYDDIVRAGYVKSNLMLSLWRQTFWMTDVQTGETMEQFSERVRGMAAVLGKVFARNPPVGGPATESRLSATWSIGEDRVTVAAHAPACTGMEIEQFQTEPDGTV